MSSLVAFLFLVTTYNYQVLRTSASTVTVDAVVEVTKTVTENVLPQPPSPPPVPSTTATIRGETTTQTSEPVFPTATTRTTWTGTSAVVVFSPPETTALRDADSTLATHDESVAKSTRNQFVTIPLHAIILAAAIVVAAVALLILCLWYKRKRRRRRRRRSSGTNEPGRTCSAERRPSSSPKFWQEQNDCDPPRTEPGWEKKFYYSDRSSWLQSFPSSSSSPRIKSDKTASDLSLEHAQERSPQSATPMSIFMDNASHGTPQPDPAAEPLSDSDQAGELPSGWTTPTCHSQQSSDKHLDNHRQMPTVPSKAYIQLPRVDDTDHWGYEIRSILHVRSVSPSVYSRDS